jgi:hypothetical protein
MQNRRYTGDPAPCVACWMGDDRLTLTDAIPLPIPNATLVGGRGNRGDDHRIKICLYRLLGQASTLMARPMDYAIASAISCLIGRRGRLEKRIIRAIEA